MESMVTMDLDSLHNFYKGKRVLVTGHTGFKGSWLCHILKQFGSEIYGYSLAPEKESLYNISGLDSQLVSHIGDIRNSKDLRDFYEFAEPEIVLHLAAQPLVRRSYEEPAYTYETNVLGTVNILECLRNHPCAVSFLNVTTDKVYLNKEWPWGYREDERLDGFDPYSNSKSCSELVTQTYKRCFFGNPDSPSISTARAGNVIGGGDFAADRIIPDCVRAAVGGQAIVVRNPNSTRPYQHVLEPLFAYLLIAARQADTPNLAGAYNVGPDDADCFRTGDLVDAFVKAWGNGLRWINQNDGGPHEANFLKLDNSLIKSHMGWHPVWNVSDAIDRIVEWTKALIAGEDISVIMKKQIKKYIDDSKR